MIIKQEFRVSASRCTAIATSRMPAPGDSINDREVRASWIFACQRLPPRHESPQPSGRPRCCINKEGRCNPTRCAARYWEPIRSTAAPGTYAGCWLSRAAGWTRVSSGSSARCAAIRTNPQRIPTSAMPGYPDSSRCGRSRVLTAPCSSSPTTSPRCTTGPMRCGPWGGGLRH